MPPRFYRLDVGFSNTDAATPLFQLQAASQHQAQRLRGDAHQCVTKRRFVGQTRRRLQESRVDGLAEDLQQAPLALISEAGVVAVQRDGERDGRVELGGGPTGEEGAGRGLTALV